MDAETVVYVHRPTRAYYQPAKNRDCRLFKSK